MVDYTDNLRGIADSDVESLFKSRQSYGDSWKKRGGIGAYMMLARKIDRLELQVEKHGYDILLAALADQRPEGIIDDIRDLRRYLMLVEAEVLQRKFDSAGEMWARAKCDCGATMGQAHRYGCAAKMGGGENE